MVYAFLRKGRQTLVFISGPGRIPQPGEQLIKRVLRNKINNISIPGDAIQRNKRLGKFPSADIAMSQLTIQLLQNHIACCSSSCVKVLNRENRTHIEGKTAKADKKEVEVPYRPFLKAIRGYNTCDRTGKSEVQVGTRTNFYFKCAEY